MFLPHGFDGVPSCLDTFGQLGGIAHASDVHEVNRRIIEDKMIVQSGHFQSVRKSGVHGWGDLIFEDDGVTHQHHPLMCRLKSGPGTESSWWR